MTTKPRTGLSELKRILQDVQREQFYCVDEYGIVKTWMREKYQLLVRQADDLHKKIKFLREEMGLTE